MKIQPKINKALMIITSLLLSACTVPGMPALSSTNNLKAGIDYKLIPINFKTTQKQNIVIKKVTKKKYKTSGIKGYTYRIGSPDVLGITVWDHPELTASGSGPKTESGSTSTSRSASASGSKVGRDGYFFYPYAGKILASNRTGEQVRQELQLKLAKFINKPQVSVEIVGFESQKAYISGKIQKPGVYEINESPLTIRDIIAQSGGLTDDASYSALLTHQNNNIHIDLDALYRKGDSRQNYLLTNGDTLHVSEIDSSDKVFVMGEVKDPGSFLINRFGLSLAEVLTDAGGMREEYANPTGIFVIRQNISEDKIPTVFQLKLNSIHSIILAKQFNLRSRDIVYITATPITRWNRVISQIFPSLSLTEATTKTLK